MFLIANGDVDKLGKLFDSGMLASFGAPTRPEHVDFQLHEPRKFTVLHLGGSTCMPQASLIGASMTSDAALMPVPVVPALGDRTKSLRKSMTRNGTDLIFVKQ